MQIADSGNVLLVAKNKARTEKCMEAWEEIVKRNAEENGSYEYQNYLDNLKQYYRLIAEHTLIKASLLKLTYKVDPELAKYLTSRGYVIRLGKRKASDSEAYANSIHAAIKKSDNLVTKIEMKRKEMTNTTNMKGQVKNFESVMGNLISLLGFEVRGDELTLARYNEYKKFIKQKYKPKEKVA
jgi:hypothetical protein